MEKTSAKTPRNQSRNHIRSDRRREDIPPAIATDGFFQLVERGESLMNKYISMSSSILINDIVTL